MLAWLRAARSLASRAKRARREASSREPGGQDLDGDLAAERVVGGLPHLAHAALPDLPGEVVVEQGLTGPQRRALVRGLARSLGHDLADRIVRGKVVCEERLDLAGGARHRPCTDSSSRAVRAADRGRRPRRRWSERVASAPCPCLPPVENYPTVHPSRAAVRVAAPGGERVGAARAVHDNGDEQGLVAIARRRFRLLSACADA